MSAAPGMHAKRSMNATWLFFVVVALVGACSAAPVAAEPSYEQLVAEALDEYARDNFAEARRLFELAHSRRPNARTLRGLGVVEYELREYVRAVEHLELALEDTRNPLDAGQRAEVQQLLDRAFRFVGRYRLRVHPEVTSVRADGRPRAARDGVELRFNPGDHQVVAEGDGRPRRVIELTVRGGEREELVLKLPEARSPGQQPTGPASQPPAQPSARPPALKPAAFAPSSGPPASAIVALSAGGLGLLTFAVAGALALDEHSKLESGCRPACSDRQLETFDSYVLSADIGLALGIVGTALGTWLWLDDGDGGEGEASLEIHSVLTPQHAGIGARGSF